MNGDDFTAEQPSKSEEMQNEDSENPYEMEVQVAAPSSALILNGKDDEDGEEEEEEDTGVDVTRKLSGDIQISLHYDHDDNIFRVYVHRALHLVPVGQKSSARPYAKVHLTSASRQLGKRKTKVSIVLAVHFHVMHHSLNFLLKGKSC